MALWLMPFLAAGLLSSGESRAVGVHFLSGQWGSQSYRSAEGQATFNELIAQTGATSIAFTIAWFQPSVDVAGPIYPVPGLHSNVRT
jgi:hypothetical protein